MNENKPINKNDNSNAAELESIIKLVKNDLDQIMQNLDTLKSNPENYNIQFYNIKHLANKIEKIEGIIRNKITSIENIAFYLYDALSKTYSHLYDYHRNGELFVYSKLFGVKVTLSVNNKLVELCTKAFWLYNTYITYDIACHNMMINHITNLASLETKQNIVLSEYKDFIEKFKNQAQKETSMRKLGLLAQIFDDLEKEKDFTGQTSKMLKKSLQNEYRRRNWSLSLLEHLKNENELKNFINAFKEAQNLQICFLIDVTESITIYYDRFKNQVLTAILDAVLSDVNTGSKRYAYIGYRERNEKYEFHQFTENIDEIREAIRNTEPGGGGGDSAEDVEFALDLFVKHILFNRVGTRLIIHVADAPCHGKRYHESNIDDSHPEWSDNIPNLLRSIKDLGCFYWFVKVNENTDKMITEFNKILAEKDGDDPNVMSIKQIDFHYLRENLKNFFEHMLYDADKFLFRRTFQ